MRHTCHARGCQTEVAPKLLMCLKHWRLVPKELQRRVWLHYRPGQEVDKLPSPDYLDAMADAIEAVAGGENSKRSEGWKEVALLPTGLLTTEVEEPL